MKDTPRKFQLTAFRSMLDKHRTSIQRGTSYDAWLKNEKLILNMPSKRMQNTTQKAEAHLGLLYRTSLELRDQIQLDLDSETEDAALSERYASCRELILPGLIKLALWRIFAAIAEEVGETAGSNDLYAGQVIALEREYGVPRGTEDTRLLMGMIQDETSIMGKLFKTLEPTLKNWGVDAEKAVDVLARAAENPDDFKIDMANPGELIGKLIDTMSQVTADGEQIGGQAAAAQGWTTEKMLESGLEFMGSSTAAGIFGNLKALQDKSKTPQQALAGLAGSLNDPEAMAMIGKLTGAEIDPTMADNLKKLTDMGMTMVDQVAARAGVPVPAGAGPSAAACEGDVCVRPSAYAEDDYE